VRENSSASPRAPGGAYYYARAGDTGFPFRDLDLFPRRPPSVARDSLARHSAGTRVTCSIIACPRSSTLHRSLACGEP